MGRRLLDTAETTEARRRMFDIEPLEPRLLFDAAPIIMTIPIQPVPIYPIIIVPIVHNGLNGSSPLTILNNRQSFTGIVATFTDDQTENTSAYSATINWGDGSPIYQASVVRDPAGGFDVLGAHTYVFGQYSPIITVTAPGANPGDAPRSLVIAPNLSVFPPPIACEAFPINAINGQAFRGTLAKYTGLDTTQIGRYSATIDWGDGGQSPGELSVNPDGSVSVIGQHVYINPGFDDIEIVLTANGAAADVAAATARCRATVANGSFAGTILNITAESGVPYNGNLAFFQFLGANQNISNLRAQILLSGSNGAPVTIPGTIIEGNNGFYVSANAIFTSDSVESVEVRIYDTTIAPNPDLGTDQQLVGLAQGSVAVSGHLQFTPQSATMTAGAESRVLLGHLTDDDPDNLWNKSFDVQINWGDGSDASQGEAVPDPAGGYDIYGTHTYPIIGYANNYSFTINITETRTSTNPAAPAGPYTYSVGGGTNSLTNSPSITVAAGSFTGFYIQTNLNNVNNGGGRISAELYTGADLSRKVGDISATVLWSDGQTTTASIIPQGANEFLVFASRNDLPPGPYSAVLSVSIGSYQKTANFSGYIAQPIIPVTPVDFSLHAHIQAVPINAFVGDHFHGVIATFTVPGAVGLASDYTCYASIGGAVNLTTTVVANGDGSFSIVADFDAINTTTSSGGYQYQSVTIYNGEKSSSANLSVNITNDPTRVTLTGENNLDFQQRELFTTTVATFTAPSPKDKPSNFTATIDWGDGTTTTGVITEQYNGTFDISGTYGYVLNSGPMTLKITVTDMAGRSIFAYSYLYLDPDPVSITPGTPTINAGTVSGNLANFIDDQGISSDPSVYRVYHAALIDWGDGTVTSGLVTTNPDGTYSVASTHDYQADGNYQIHILVRQNTFYAWQPPVFDPISYNGFGDVTADAMVGAGSSIVANPDSDFGVTFYVHVVGASQSTANPAQTFLNIPYAGNAPTPVTSIASPTISVFSNSAITSAAGRPNVLGTDSESTGTWLASNVPLLGTEQSSNSDLLNDSTLVGISD